MPQLVRQLLKNFSQQSLSALRNIGCKSEIEVLPTIADPGLQLLLQFQRLLLLRLYTEESSHNLATSELLLQYMAWLCDHATDNLKACSLFLEQRPDVNIISLLMTVMRNSVVGTMNLN